MSIARLERHRVSIYLLVLIVVVLAVAGLSRLRTEANYRVYFDPHDALLALEAQISERFALSDSAVLVLRAARTPLLSDSVLAAVTRFAAELQALDFVRSVTGFHQLVPVSPVDGADDPFADAHDQAWRDASPEVRRQRLLTHPRGGDLLSADGRLALLEVQVDLPPGDSARQVLQAMAQLRALSERLLLADGLIGAIDYSGVLALNHAYIDVVRHDLRVFVPGLLLLMAAVLYGVFRQWPLVLLPLVSGLLAALMAMGVAGWAGWTLAAINAFTPIIVVSLHLAASMHLIVTYLQQRVQSTPGALDDRGRNGLPVGGGGGRAAQLSPGQAMQRSVDFNVVAMLLSALTTVAGFLLLSLSPSPPIRVVGYCVALGVVFSFVFNVLLLPLLLPRLRLDLARAARSVARLDVLPLVRRLRARARWVVAVAVVLAALSLLSLSRLEINDSVYAYFPADHSFSQGIGTLDREFDGCVRLSYVLDAGAPGAVLSADYERVQAAFRTWLGQQSEVGGVREVFGLMHGLGIALPQAERLLQQRSVQALGIQRELAPALSATRVEVVLRALSSRELIAFNERARAWLARHSGEVAYRGGSGADLIFAWLGQRNAGSMFGSLALALALIGLLVGLLFRDPAMAALGLVCNLLPLVLVYAAWFAAGGYISLGAAVVLGMIMGVIVDDTLHLLCKYRRLREQGAANPVLDLGRRVLPAVWITSLTLAVGLSIGLLSDFRPLRELSFLSAAIILAALLVDALLLPAVLTLKERSG